jgi:hypothetical protein
MLELPPWGIFPSLYVRHHTQIHMGINDITSLGVSGKYDTISLQTMGDCIILRHSRQMAQNKNNLIPCCFQCYNYYTLLKLIGIS